MQTVERASLFITRWLARHPFSEAVKFDDDEIQKAVIVLEELNHWLPINFRYIGEVQIQISYGISGIGLHQKWWSFSALD